MGTRVSAALPFLCGAAVSLDHGLLSEASTFSRPPEPAAVAPSCPSPKSNHVGTFNPNTAQWRLRRKRPGWIESASGDITFVFGNPNDTPLMGDWDGNGSQTQGGWRAGTFFLSNTLGGAATVSVTIGGTPYVPVVGDWDGNHTTTVGTFKNGVWRIRNANTNTAPETVINFGQAGDLPVTGDWNGDGVVTVGVFRPVIPGADPAFLLRNSNTSGPAELTITLGLAGDTPIVGDWDGNGVTTIGVRRGSTFQLRNANTSGVGELIFDFGTAADKPVVGNWSSSDPAYSTVPPPLTNFFPLAIDWQPLSSFAAWKAEGINTLMRVRDGVDIDDFNAAANANGLRMIRHAPQNLDDDVDKPLLLAWAIADEPEQSGHLENMRQEYQRLRSSSNPRPIFFNFAGPRVLQTLDNVCNGPGDGSNENCYPDYIATEDWVSHDIYPVHDQGGDFRVLGATLDKLRRWSGSKLQLAYIETSDFERNGTHPTPAQLRGEVWSAIIHGARGLLYFPHNACDASGVCHESNATPPAVQAEMRIQNARITSVASVLQRPINPPLIGITAPTPLEATWRTSGGQRYFFVLNLSSGSVTRTMTLCGAVPSAPITVVGENRSVGAAGNPGFSDSFAPYVVHIYRF